MKNTKVFIAVLISTLVALCFACCDSSSLPETTTDGKEFASADSGDAKSPKDAVKTSVKLQYVNDTVILATATEDSGGAGLYLLTDEFPVFSDGKNVSIKTLEPGTVIDIMNSGIALTTFPMMFGNIYRGDISETGSYPLGIYLDAVRDIYKEDTALNGEKLALDLTNATVISENEKAALSYILSVEMANDKVDVFLSDFKTLQENGTIDENGNFMTGCLVTIEDKGFDGTSFTYSVSKYCSGTGAIGKANIKVNFADGKFTVDESTKNNFWIS